VQISHGVIRRLANERSAPPADPESRRRVLFWRVLSHEAGGDLCLKAFDQLAPEFPDLSFDLALRPSVHEIPGAEELAQKHANVHVLGFPYAGGATIGDFVGESLCAIFPFRQLTIHPQLAIAETLAAGTPCVASSVGSIPELVVPGRTGALTSPGDAQDLVDTLRTLLNDRRQLARLAAIAAGWFEESWNWTKYVERLEELYYNLQRAKAAA
jgi:glycosyltransferase involved in cell wall biosynthesis